MVHTDEKALKKSEEAKLITLPGMWSNLNHLLLLPIKKHCVKLLWHKLAHEAHTLRCLIIDRFTAGAKRSGASGTDRELLIL
jgi:hypothetical protein